MAFAGIFLIINMILTVFHDRIVDMIVRDGGNKEKAETILYKLIDGLKYAALVSIIIGLIYLRILK